jgi:hypothetical protein
MSTEIEQKGKVLKIICGSPDRPLKIGDIEIQCYVLEDETRVLSQRELQQGIGLSKSGPTLTGEHRLSNLIARISANAPELNVKLMSSIQNPIKFMTPWGHIANGYEATILADICEAILKARDTKLLLKQQIHIADQCEILMRGFARVGIIALVDEATGYQEIRAREALEEILRNFISAELLKWVKTFPDEFYRQMFRLRDWQYYQFSVKRPSVAGRITNDIIYERLAPGVLDELKRIIPKDVKGRRKHRYHQRLTADIGHPALREHIASVITLMKVSNSWRRFYAMLNRGIIYITSQIRQKLFVHVVKY